MRIVFAWIARTHLKWSSMATRNWLAATSERLFGQLRTRLNLTKIPVRLSDPHFQGANSLIVHVDVQLAGSSAERGEILSHFTWYKNHQSRHLKVPIVFVFDLHSSPLAFCSSSSVSVGFINLSLQLFTVLHAQIGHCCFQALVTEPVLNRSHRDVVIHPPRCARFQKSVQYEMLANRMGFTTDLYLTFLVTAFGQRRSAVAAIKPGTLRNGFQFAQEVIFGCLFR
jgi:hypothetical protein